MYGTRNQVVLPLNLETRIKSDDPVFKLAEICDTLDYTKLYKAYVRTYRKYDPASQRCAASGVTFEDIIQSSFVALAGAVKDYKAEKGYLLSTYLTLHLKCVYNELIGRRTQKIDLLNICESLNVPIGNDNDTELMDTVADIANSPEELDERIFQKELSTVLHKCVDSLPEELRSAIKGRYFDKLTYAEIEKQQHLSNGGSRLLLSKAFCKLRSGGNRRRLNRLQMRLFQDPCIHRD